MRLHMLLSFRFFFCLLVCFSYTYRQITANNNRALTLGSHPFQRALFFYLLSHHQTFASNPVLLCFPPPLVWHWIPTFPTWVSHGFFSLSFPSPLQPKELDRETQTFLGPLEWITSSCGDWNHAEQGAGMIMGAAVSWRALEGKCLWQLQGVVLLIDERWRMTAWQKKQGAQVCLTAASSFLTLLPLGFMKGAEAAAIAKRISRVCRSSTEVQANGR